jgi:hypothetical protein
MGFKMRQGGTYRIAMLHSNQNPPPHQIFGDATRRRLRDAGLGREFGERRLDAEGHCADDLKGPTDHRPVIHGTLPLRQKSRVTQ